MKLEQEAKAKQRAMSQELQYAVFDAMKIVTCTPEEVAAVARFSAEFERVRGLVNSQRLAVIDPRKFRYR